MVTRGGPTVQLLPAAGQRVAPVALQLRQQNLQRRQQNIQANLGELRAEIQREQLQEQARQFDVDQIRRRETLLIESALSGRRLTISEAGVQLQGRRQAFEEQRFVRGEQRAERDFALGERSFTEQIRRQQRIEGIQDASIEERRESLFEKEFRSDLKFLGENLLRFDPDTKEVTLPDGLKVFVERMISRAQESGLDITIPQLIEAATPQVAQAARQRISAEGARNLQGRFVEAQIGNLDALAASRTPGAQQFGKVQAVQFQQASRRIDDLRKLGRDLPFDIQSAEEELIKAQIDLTNISQDDETLAPQRALQEQLVASRQRALVGLQAQAQSLPGQIQQLQAQQQGLIAPGPIGGAPAPGRVTGLVQPGQVPANTVASAVVRLSDFSTALERTNQDLKFTDEEIAKRKKVVAPEDREQHDLVMEKSQSVRRFREATAEENLRTAEQQITTGIANLPTFADAFRNAVVLNKQVSDLEDVLNKNRRILERSGLTGDQQVDAERQISIQQRQLGNARQFQIILRNKLDEFSEFKSDLVRAADIGRQFIGDASRPEMRGLTNRLFDRALPQLSLIYGKVNGTFQSESEKATRGQGVSIEMRNGSFYNQLKAIRSQVGREAADLGREVVGENPEDFISDQTMRRFQGGTVGAFPTTVPDALLQTTRSTFNDFFERVTFRGQIRKNRRDISRTLSLSLGELQANAKLRPENMPGVAAAMIAFGFSDQEIIDTLKPFDLFNLVNFFDAGPQITRPEFGLEAPRAVPQPAPEPTPESEPAPAPEGQ